MTEYEFVLEQTDTPSIDKYFGDSFFNSHQERHMQKKHDNKFIELHSSFSKQMKELHNYYTEIDDEKIQTSLATISTNLLSLDPRVISIQLTYDKSLLYTLFKDGNSVSYELFFGLDEETENEAVITFFDKNDNISSYTDSEEETLSYLNSILLSE